jgi:hypothetical protein
MMMMMMMMMMTMMMMMMDNAWPPVAVIPDQRGARATPLRSTRQEGGHAMYRVQDCDPSDVHQGLAHHDFERRRQNTAPRRSQTKIAMGPSLTKVSLN